MIFATPLDFGSASAPRIEFVCNAISFSAPAPFSEAQELLAIKSLLPTNLSSGELNDIASEILERAFFSARVNDAEYLQEISDTVDEYLKGQVDLATARLRLKDKLDELGYDPEKAGLEPDEVGGLKDLSSDVRINLQLRMNADMASGYGQWLQSQRTLDAAPAQELYRAYQRKIPRNWIKRWSDAGGKMSSGRLIALKNDPIWTRISRFGTPYPPFDYNSGMRVKSVDRQTAMDAGLIDLNTQIEPQTRDFNEDLKVSSDIRNEALRKVLEEEGYQFQLSEDGTEVLTL